MRAPVNDLWAAVACPEERYRRELTMSGTASARRVLHRPPDGTSPPSSITPARSRAWLVCVAVPCLAQEDGRR
jgi:hypothetical protein